MAMGFRVAVPLDFLVTFEGMVRPPFVTIGGRREVVWGVGAISTGWGKQGREVKLRLCG